MQRDPARASTEVDLPDAVRKLLARIETRAALPGLKGSAGAVQKLTRDEGARLQALAAAVLGDPALSHRLLRSSNAAHFLPTGAGSIASVQRAIAVLGFDAVHLLSKALRLLEADPGNASDRLVRHELMRALLAGRLATRLTFDGRRLEEAQLASVFRNLGRLLVAVHLPDDARSIRARVPRNRWPLSALEQSASRDLLGMDYGHVGAHVARLWGWPEMIRTAMVRKPWPSVRPPDARSRLPWIAQCANDLADLMLETDPQAWADGCRDLAEASHAALDLDAKALQDALSSARQELQDLVRQVGLEVEQMRPWQASDPVHGHDAPPPAAGAGAVADAGRDEGADSAALDAAVEAAAPSGDAAAPSTPDAQHLTRAALQFTSHLLDRKARRALPDSALAALHVGLRARRAMLWRRRAAGAALEVVSTLGPSLPPQVSQGWTVDPARGKDLFSRLCASGNVSLIHDASRTDIAPHLPDPFRRHGVARCFMVLPVVAHGRTLGMIFLDRPDHDPFILDGEAMQLVRTLRDQTALAWHGQD